MGGKLRARVFKIFLIMDYKLINHLSAYVIILWPQQWKQVHIEEKWEKLFPEVNSGSLWAMDYE